MDLREPLTTEHTEEEGGGDCICRTLYSIRGHREQAPGEERQEQAPALQGALTFGRRWCFVVCTKDEQ